MSIEPLTKPSRLARDVSKWKRKVERESARAKADRQAANKWKALSAQVKHRDASTCRVCGLVTYSGGNPEHGGQSHHIVYRSALGKDDMSNLVWVCNLCSDKEHTHKISITGTADNLTVETL